MTRLFVATIATAIAALALLGGAASTAPERDRAVATVKVAAIPSLNFLPFYVADAKGFFAKRGIKVEITNVASPIQALASGDVDFSIQGADTAMVAAAQGRPFPIVVVLLQNQGFHLVARKDLNLPNVNKPYPLSARDLKGKKIGVTAVVGANLNFVSSALGEAGLERDTDYTLVALGQASNMIAALAGGRIDAALLFEPFGHQAINSGVAVNVIEQLRGEGPPELRDQYGPAVATSQGLLSSRPQLARRFVAAIVEAGVFNRNLRKNNRELIDIAVKYTGVTDRAAITSALKVEATAAYPYFTCARAAKQLVTLLKQGVVRELPACGQLAALSIVPKEPKQQPQKKKKKKRAS